MTMAPNIPAPGEQIVIDKGALASVLNQLRDHNYTLIGPKIKEGAILYEEISGFEDLPVGWVDVQEPGSYRLENNGSGRFFDFVVGPNSWKQYLYPNGIELFATKQIDDGFQVSRNEQDLPQYAFIGARACELEAIQIHDRIFIDADIQDPHYKARREQAFILAVNCTKPGNTCFCASMDSGPKCKGDFDLALTELKDVFLVDVGSPLGAHMLENSDWRLAGALETNRAKTILNMAEYSMGRELETGNLPDILLGNLGHPRWDEVGDRCMSCGNCTMVCPTCFCTDVEDLSDLSGQNTARVRVWDSCFNPDFSYVHGGTVRPGVCSRYRQWLTHKLASWNGQFGVPGCVGCGRCITWCPVGIDITEEAAAIRGEVS